MKSKSKEINIVSQIVEKKEAKNIELNKPMNKGKFPKRLTIIESIVVGLIICVVIIVLILTNMNYKKNRVRRTNSNSSLEPLYDTHVSSTEKKSFLKRKLISCPAGYYLNGLTCKKCSAGTYSTFGKNRCLKCNSGTFSKAGASSCTQCSAGTYSSTGASSCMKCGAGTFSFAGASQCKKCEAGTYSKTGSSYCTHCSPGTYSTLGSSKCIECLPGKYSSKGSSSCLSCSAGYYSNRGSAYCFKCDPGTYSSQGSGSCKKCEAGSYSSRGSSKCSKCAAGYYSKIGSSSCTKCPVGKTSKVGSSSCTNLCNPGSYYKWGSCYVCPAGTSSVSDFSKCLDCPKGTSSSSGASTCKKCPAGTYSSSTRSSICLECPAGTYSGIGADSCKKCPPGTTSKKGSSLCVNDFMKGGKKIISFALSSVLHNLEAFARMHNINTADLGAKFLDMRIDENGIYHADFDCWQHLFGYNKLYDIVFELGTSMDLNKEGIFNYNGQNYILWAWKGDYINLGAGAELGIYYGGISQNSHWKVDKSLAMPMTLTLEYKNKGTIVNNWDNWGNNAWWITAFNPKYKNVKAKDLTAKFSVKFKNSNMFKEFSKISRKGWKYDQINKIAYLTL